MQFSKLLGNKDTGKSANPIIAAMQEGAKDTAKAPKTEHISQTRMQSMLQGEFNPSKLEEQLQNCCNEHDKCSDDLKSIAKGIEDLYALKPAKLADGVAAMESSLQEKCHKIKESRAIISQLLTQSTVAMANAETQMTMETRNAET